MAEAIPKGFHSLTPQLIVKDGNTYIQFLEKAFGAERQFVMPHTDGKGVSHAGVRIGDSTLFVSDQDERLQPTNANTYLYVRDVDKVFNRAVEAGAKVLTPVSDMYWGDRWCLLEDPTGNRWQIATHKEDVAPEEMQRRASRAGAR